MGQAPPLQLLEADLNPDLVPQNAGPERSIKAGQDRDDMAVFQPDPASSQRKQASHHAVERDPVIAKGDDVALGRHRKAGGGFLTAANVQFDLEVELLPLIKRGKLGGLYRRSVHEDVLASVVGGDEAVTLERIIPFYCAGSHFQTSI